MRSNLDALADAWEWTGEDVVAHALPLFHVHGLVLGLLGPLRRGGQLRHLVSFEPRAAASAVRAGATMLFGVPTMYHRLASAGLEPGLAAALRGARLLVSGSAPLPAPTFDRIERLCGQRIVERYGLTETLMNTAVRADGERRPGYVGGELDGVEVRVLADDGGVAESDDETIGEAAVRGPNVFTAYLNQPKATAAAIRDGWFLTGDLATRSPDGYLRIVGRRSTDLIKTGGYKVGAGEVEVALLEHPGVAEAAVTGHRIPTWGSGSWPGWSSSRALWFRKRPSCPSTLPGNWRRTSVRGRCASWRSYRATRWGRWSSSSFASHEPVPAPFSRLPTKAWPLAVDQRSMRIAIVLVVGLALALSGVATTAAFARTCPCSIFSDSDGPAHPGFNDGQPLELGVKFQSVQAGTVTGVRFYKSAHDSGDHSVHLWASDGTLLASAPSTGESPSGWQTVMFVEPVEISADTTYIASYHSSAGWYTFAYGFFSQGIDNPPLRALADGEDGPNGVYAYGASAFPTSTYKASGYWVDVVFEPRPEPVPAPRAVKLSPDRDAAAFDGAVRVTFDAPVDSSTITTETFRVRPESGDPLPAEVSYDEDARSATWQPRRPLAPSTRYVATLRGGAGGVAGVAGTPLAEDVTWRFTTASGDSRSPDVADRAPKPARPCASRRRFRIRLAVPAGAEVRGATLNGRALTVSRGARLTALVDLRDLPKGSYSVHVRVRLADGRRLLDTRSYRTCASRSRSQRGNVRGSDGASRSSEP